MKHGSVLFLTYLLEFPMDLIVSSLTMMAEKTIAKIQDHNCFLLFIVCTLFDCFTHLSVKCSRLGIIRISIVYYVRSP